jgi:hypothetical protein
MNRKYPEPLPELPEQIVSSEKLINHIEEECEVSIWDTAFLFMQTNYPNEHPSNYTGIAEKVVEMLKEHPSLNRVSPNSSCIGEYRVVGEEWVKFINYIRHACSHCRTDDFKKAPQSVDDDVEVDVDDDADEDDDVADVDDEDDADVDVKENSVSLTGVVETKVDETKVVETKVDDSVFDGVDEQIKDFYLKTVPQFLETKEFDDVDNYFDLPENATSKPLKGPKGYYKLSFQATANRARGYYMRYINNNRDLYSVYKIFSDEQKAKLVELYTNAVKRKIYQKEEKIRPGYLDFEKDAGVSDDVFNTFCDESIAEFIKIEEFNEIKQLNTTAHAKTERSRGFYRRMMNHRRPLYCVLRALSEEQVTKMTDIFRERVKPLF